MATTMREFELFMAMEFGYKACERHDNFQKALSDFKKILYDETDSSSQAKSKQIKEKQP